MLWNEQEPADEEFPEYPINRSIKAQTLYPILAFNPKNY